MVFRKRARARRPLRRRKTRRGSSKVPKATKAFVKKAISTKMESKMVQLSAQHSSIEEGLPVYKKYPMYAQSAVGVTDRGRIGNTIFATKIVVKYKISVEWDDIDPENPDILVPEQGLVPIWFNFFLVRKKTNSINIEDQWFKPKDRGQEFQAEPLDFSNVQNGLNVLNTDMYTVLAMKKVRMHIDRQSRTDRKTSAFVYRFKKPLKIHLQENSTNVTDTALISPLIELVMYPYWGGDSQWGQNWLNQYSIQMYYKD